MTLTDDEVLHVAVVDAVAALDGRWRVDVVRVLQQLYDWGHTSATLDNVRAELYEAQRLGSVVWSDAGWRLS